MFKLCEKQNNSYIKSNIKEYVKTILEYKDNFLENTFNYLTKFNSIYYPKMEITLLEHKLENKINILEELINYLIPLKILNKVVIIKKLKKIAESSKPLTQTDKKFIIVNIENKPFTEHFLEYIKSKYNILPELEMLYGKYSSILHLIIISQTVKYKYELSFKYISSEVELYNDNKIFIYTADKYNKLCNSKSTWIKQLIIRYCYFNYILETNKTPKALCFFLVDFPKLLYNTGIIGPAEINTGITNGVYINITRKEEALKTLLHELIHFHEMDFRNIPQDLNNLLHKHFSNTTEEGYNMKLNLFEAYTEFIASLLNICLFYDYIGFIKKEKILFNLYINYFIDKLTRQIVYTYSKCYRLIKYFNCQLVIKNGGITRCEFNQKTNSVSYFIIKSYFYNYIIQFIKCIDISTMKFIYCDSSFNKLFKIINLGVNNNNLNELYKKSYYNEKENNKLKKDNSMKMVCITEEL
jgi:glutamate synthase domain-containing protein 3